MSNKRTSSNYVIQFFQACQYSLKGVIFVYKTETSFRRNLFFLFLSLLLSYYFSLSFIYFWAINIPFIAGLAIECLNTAIESIVDQLEVENELMGAAKDCGSAAVAIMLLIGGAMWVHYIYLVYFG
uniref:Diacylglycerol kinase n=1 Tax=OCS116 cluster bacterium TaxID=2030921 RepID=A0A2A4YTM4_9PROT